MNLTNLSETKFDCESVRTVTTNFAVNSNQLHIVEINNGSIKEISSCQQRQDILTVIDAYPVSSFVDGGSFALNDSTNIATIEEDAGSYKRD